MFTMTRDSEPVESSTHPHIVFLQYLLYYSYLPIFVWVFQVVSFFETECRGQEHVRTRSEFDLLDQLSLLRFPLHPSVSPEHYSYIIVR